MDVKTYLKVFGVGVAISVMAGCAEVPQQDIDAAKAAIETAKAAEAETYAASDFQAAQDSLAAAMAEIETQNSEFAIFRSYDKAQTLLKATINTANMAHDNAVSNKAQVQAEVQDLMAQAKTALMGAKDLLAQAPKGKDTRAALEAIQNELTTVEASIAEATSLLGNNNPLAARDRLKAGLEKTTSISAELTQAIKKKTRRP